MMDPLNHNLRETKSLSAKPVSPNLLDGRQVTFSGVFVVAAESPQMADSALKGQVRLLRGLLGAHVKISATPSAPWEAGAMKHPFDSREGESPIDGNRSAPVEMKVRIDLETAVAEPGRGLLPRASRELLANHGAVNILAKDFSILHNVFSDLRAADETLRQRNMPSTR